MIGTNAHQWKVTLTKKMRNKYKKNLVDAKQVVMGIDFCRVLC